jgi:surfactin synthase thioesterase subunit/glycosyltransferase involved in cell wall biosynthesis
VDDRLAARPLRILLTSNAAYAPPRGGSTRSNLAWLRHLSAAGCRCLVVSAAAGTADETAVQDGIEIRSFHDLARRPAVVGEQIRAERPDWVLVSSEDLGHVLLREAGQAAPGRIVYLAHTPQFLPFGPESWNPDARATEIVRHARAVVVIGQHMAAYVERHTGVRPHIIHPPIYTAPPWPALGRFDGGRVLMINPCRVKGIGIFAELARRMPRVPFAALIGWGTTTADRELLADLSNVTLLASVPDINDALAGTSVLLMPSIWYEGFGLIAMEAMLRGIPVVSSDSGGLKEAKQATGFIIPVRPVERYLAEFDETHMPKPVEPPQDIEPWVEALRILLGDRATYEQEARRARERAVHFVSSLRASDFEAMLTSLGGPSLRILLAHNSLYYPAHGGGDKSNRLLMEALAARGHTVRVVARTGDFGAEPERQWLAQLADRGLTATVRDGAAGFVLHGVEVRTLTSNPHLRAYLNSQINEFRPDVILTSTDDPAQLLFEVALRAGDARVVHLVRATIAVPFGPDSSMESAARTGTLGRADAIVGVSEYVARYVREHGGMPAVHVPISLMEPGEPAQLGRFDNPFVLFGNPCAVKGIDIFLGLADAMPDVAFAAVPTWGTNAQDLAALHARPNVTVLAAVDDMDELFRRTRVLLVPSVWAEARSRIVVEAMLRGVPVIASDIGGIPEAKLGVPYLLPVNPVRGYKAAVDENMVPVPDVSPQDLGPWITALRRLTTDEPHWSEIAEESRRAALAYARELSVEPFERLLRDVAARPRQAAAASRLSDDKRRLLALRLKQRAATPSSKWFPVLEPGVLRLFCFPHAGGGTLLYRSWRDPLKGVASLAPACLPGREHRLSEAPVDDMAQLVEALAGAIRPHLDQPFAFFGHSMGGAVAFELARALRRSGAPMPKALIVSAARAPQFRENYTPPADPDDGCFIAELRRLEGVPTELLEHPEALRILLPALKADARLYRRYVYRREDPLDVPVLAYRGSSDPNVRPEHVESWGVETTARFGHREFAGGHFYLQSHRDEFLKALAADLAALRRT